MYRTVAQLPLSSEIGPFEVGGSSSRSGNAVESQYLAFGNKVQLPLLELGPPTSNGPISELRGSCATVRYMVEPGGTY